MCFRSPLPAAALLFCGALLLPAPTPLHGLAWGLLGAAGLAAGGLAARGLHEPSSPDQHARRPISALLLVPISFFPLGLFVSSSAPACQPGRDLERFLAERGGALADPAEVRGRLTSEPARLPDLRGGCLLEIEVRSLRASRVTTSLRGGARIRVPDAMGLALDPCALVPGSILSLASTLALPEPFRNPGSHDARAQLHARGFVASGRSPSARLVEIVKPPGPLELFLSTLRRTFLATQARAFGLAGEPDSVGTAGAIVLGYRAEAPEEMVKALRLAGTAHLLAISGFNVALLVVCVRSAALLAGAGRLSSILLVLGSLGIYVGLADRQPSVLRAAGTACILEAALLAGRRPEPVTALAVVFLLFAGSSPWTSADISLQLSFVAVAALVTIGADLAGALPGPRWIAWSVAANIVALAATAPLTALLFNRATPGALVANLAAVPLMALAFVASAAAPVLTALSPALSFFRVDIDPGLDAGTLLAELASLCFEGSSRASGEIASLPWMSYPVCTPPAWLPPATLMIAALGRWSCLPTRMRRCLLAAAAAMIAWPALPAERAPAADGRSLTITFLDVGQGSSALVETPDGLRLLVDAGGFAGSTFDVGERVVSRALLTMGIRRLDAVAVSHADFDHSGGIPSILEAFPGAELWLTSGARRSERMASIAELALGRGRTLRLLLPGRRFRFGGALVEALHPPRGWDRPGSNDDSLVLRIEHGEDALVLPGDIGQAAESALAARTKPAGLLLVAHHGSRTSSTGPFLSSLRPAWAVISCGRRNRYGHPAPEVTRRIEAAGARILRTDELGAIRVVLSGRGGDARIATWNGRGWAQRRDSREPVGGFSSGGGPDRGRSRRRGGPLPAPRRGASPGSGGSLRRGGAGGGG